MRKFLLILMLAPLGALAQSGSEVAQPPHTFGVKSIEENSEVRVPVTNLIAKTQLSGGPEFFIIQPTDTFSMGTTAYDLQTNGSVARRIVLYPDGEITAVWTTSPLTTDKTFTIRGTGYNHYFSNSSSWLLPAGNLTQPAEQKNLHSGWPNPCIDSTGSPVTEFCISHSPGGVINGITTSTLQRIDNQKIGGNSWTQTTLPPSNTNSPLWPRVVQSGNYAYMIAGYSPLPNDTEEIKGIKDPVIYYRSTDGGTTWTNEGTLPGYDTSGNISYSGLYGSSDDYAIDAQDSTVAILIGGYFHDLTLWKSTDYGKTFKETIIDTFQVRYNHIHKPGILPAYTLATIADTMMHYTNDGSVSLILDKKDKAHVFYGVRGVKTLDGRNYDSLFEFNDGYNGILHWDETNQHKAIIGYSPDLNGDGQLEAGNGYVVQISGVDYFEYGDDGLTSMPTTTIDANGYIYCIYSVYMEAIDTTLANPAELDESNGGSGTWRSFLHYRDLFITYSKDGGNTWATEQNLTKTPSKEEVFPALSRSTDSKLHLEYMVDGFAGNYVGGTTGPTRTNVQTIPDFNTIMYMGININDVLAGNFGTPANYEGIMPEQYNNPLFTISSIYPNPSEKGDVNIDITMNHVAPGSIQIYDLAGQMVSTQDIGTLTYGKQIKNINTSGLAAGMYFVKVNAGGYNTTAKLVVE